MSYLKVRSMTGVGCDEGCCISSGSSVPFDELNIKMFIIIIIIIHIHYMDMV